MQVHTVVTWSEIRADDDPTVISTLIDNLRTEVVIEWCSWVSALLENRGSSEEQRIRAEIEAAGQVCTVGVARSVINMLANGRASGFLTQRQLLMAARLAILHGLPGPGREVVPGAVGELLLRINDLLYGEYSEGDDARAYLLRHALQEAGGTNNDQTRYLLPRYFDLLLHTQVNPEDERDAIDVVAEFQRATGLAIQQYMACGLLFWGGFQQCRDVRNRAEVERMLASWYRRASDVTVLDRGKKCFRATRQELQQDLHALMKDYPDTLVPLRDRPLYTREDGTVLPLNSEALLEKAAIGPYWELHKAFRKQEKLGVFTKYMGKVFQPYMEQFLEALYGAVPDATFHPESSVQRISGRKRESPKPPLDGYVVEGGSLIILEITTTAFPALLLEQGDPPRLFSADAGSKERSRMPDARFVEKLHQLHAAITGLESVWHLPGVEIESVAEVFLVIVLLHPMPQTPEIWERLRHAAGSKWPEWRGGYTLPGKRSPIRVRGPQVLACEELEMIEPLLRSGSYRLDELLRRKLMDPQYRVLSMKDWLLLQSGISVPENRRLLERFTEIAGELAV